MVEHISLVYPTPRIADWSVSGKESYVENQQTSPSKQARDAAYF